jgi:hypothetical protein
VSAYLPSSLLEESIRTKERETRAYDADAESENKKTSYLPCVPAVPAPRKFGRLDAMNSSYAYFGFVCAYMSDRTP